MFLPLHLVTPDFRVYFATSCNTGGRGLIPLSLGTAPCIRKSDIQRDNLHYSTVKMKESFREASGSI